MKNSTELELTESTKKFISVGNNTFLNSKGSTEVCRKGLKGEYCKRHNGGSLQDTQKVRAILDSHAERTKQKLSPFEKGCIWLYSVLTRSPLADAEVKYAELIAMYSFIKQPKPTDKDIRGLQKVLLRLAETSSINKSKMDDVKMMIKKMTVGKDFTEAGYYTLKDLSKDALNKMKIGAIGLGLGGTLLLSGCSNNSNPFTTSVADTESYKVKDSITDGFLIKDEQVTDKYGTYTRTSIDTSGLTKDSKGKELSGDSLEASKAAVKFLSLEALDSIALDNNDRYEEWKANVAPKYISSQYIGEILGTNEEGNATLVRNIILNDMTDAMPTLIRDNGVRIADKRLNSITVTDNNNGTYYVDMSGSAVVYANDAEASAWFNKSSISTTMEGTMYNPDGTAMTKEQQAEWLQKNVDGANLPAEMKDGKPNASIINFSSGYMMVKEGGEWKIAGYNSSFEINQSLIQKNAGSQMDYRNKVK